MLISVHYHEIAYDYLFCQINLYSYILHTFTEIKIDNKKEKYAFAF